MSSDLKTVVALAQQGTQTQLVKVNSDRVVRISSVLQFQTNILAERQEELRAVAMECGHVSALMQVAKDAHRSEN